MTKVDIFSGFLGAGKTTLIKKLIKEAYKGEMIVVIENEFGKIGIDGGFLKEAGIQITEMNSGCICCSLVGDFGKALAQVKAHLVAEHTLRAHAGAVLLDDAFFRLFGQSEASLSIHYLLCPLMKVALFVAVYAIYRRFSVKK